MHFQHLYVTKRQSLMKLATFQPLHQPTVKLHKCLSPHPPGEQFHFRNGTTTHEHSLQVFLPGSTMNILNIKYLTYNTHVYTQVGGGGEILTALHTHTNTHSYTYTHTHTHPHTHTHTHVLSGGGRRNSNFVCTIYTPTPHTHSHTHTLLGSPGQ